jgi:hypothetical protein
MHFGLQHRERLRSPVDFNAYRFTQPLFICGNCLTCTPTLQARSAMDVGIAICQVPRASSVWPRSRPGRFPSDAASKVSPLGPCRRGSRIPKRCVAFSCSKYTRDSASRGALTRVSQAGSWKSANPDLRPSIDNFQSMGPSGIKRLGRKEAIPQGRHLSVNCATDDHSPKSLIRGSPHPMHTSPQQSHVNKT